VSEIVGKHFLRNYSLEEQRYGARKQTVILPGKSIMPNGINWMCLSTILGFKYGVELFGYNGENLQMDTAMNRAFFICPIS
jgi:hypothetical protein